MAGDIPVDYETAYSNFARAAQMGHHNGMYKLGDMYYNGHLVAKDPAIAFFWFNEAEQPLIKAVRSIQTLLSYRPLFAFWPRAFPKTYCRPFPGFTKQNWAAIS
jgi:FOG: TPR repeat, SEL1 subfamily